MAMARVGAPLTETPTTLLPGPPVMELPPARQAAPGPGPLAPVAYPAAPGYPPGGPPAPMMAGPQAGLAYPPVLQPAAPYPATPPMQGMAGYAPPMMGQPLQVFAPTIVQQINVVQPAPPPAQYTTVVVANSGPGILTRAIYFIFIGWWLSFLWISLAWALNATIIGLPLGLFMLNRVPQVMTLSPGAPRTTVRTQYRDAYGRATSAANAATVDVVLAGQDQYPVLARALYFLFIGWWASLIWTYLAYAIAVTIIGLPISFMMFNTIGLVTTLHRN
jgi:uncharacterized membrane protein YccF (DUF307 family)